MKASVVKYKAGKEHTVVIATTVDGTIPQYTTQKWTRMLMASMAMVGSESATPRMKLQNPILNFPLELFFETEPGDRALGNYRLRL